MKRLLLMLLTMLCISSAHAQDLTANGVFGLRVEAIPSALSDGRLTPAYPVLGFHVGLEFGSSQWRVGLRGGFNSLLIFSVSGQAELYGRYVLENNDSLLFGVGTRVTVQLFTPSWQDYHLLLSYRFARGFFVEVQPGFAFGRASYYTPSGNFVTANLSAVIATFSLGWSWDF